MTYRAYNSNSSITSATQYFVLTTNFQSRLASGYLTTSQAIQFNFFEENLPHNENGKIRDSWHMAMKKLIMNPESKTHSYYRSFYLMFVGYVGGQYWGGNTYGNVTSLQTMQNYSGSFGAINNVNTSYIASSQPAMLYSQTSGRNAVMTGQNQRH